MVLACFLHPAMLSELRADGGTLRLSKRRGDYRISVFTAPTPFRAGPVDVSVLVQDARTGDPLPQAEVTVRATPRGRSDTLVVQSATHDAATNKLFHAALLELPEAGWWKIDIAVAGQHGEAAVQFEVEAAAAAPAWLDLWPWLAWPALAIVVFCIHRILVRRHAHRSADATMFDTCVNSRPSASSGCVVSTMQNAAASGSSQHSVPVAPQ